MDSTGPCPSMSTEPTQAIQTLPQDSPPPTPTPTSNSAQNPLDSTGTNTAESQRNPASTTFVIPTVSPADWAQTQRTSNPSANSISQPAMTTTDPPKKRRGRPPKPPALVAQKPPKISKSIQPSQPDSDTPNEATQNLKGNTQNVDEEDTEITKAKKKCWFTPGSDGKSDIDLVAEWCSNFKNFNAWRTQQKNVVCERVAAYLVSKGHVDRGGRECKKKIEALRQWFNDANNLRKSTGEGNKDADVEFTVSKEDIAVFKWNKRRVKKYDEDEGGSLEVRILRICPWYEELEPVLRDRPSASPLASRDSLGACEPWSTSFEPGSTSFLPNNNQPQSPTKSTQPYTWEETPPHHQPEDDLPSSQEQARSSQEQAQPSVPQASQSIKSSRAVTPTYPASKRIQSNSKEIPLSISTKESPQNSLDFTTALHRIPTKEDRDESKSRFTASQEKISSNFAKEMSNMITTNRAAELASKENIAISKMNVELRIACSKMVMELIRASMDPTTAEAVALRSLPDIDPGQSARQLPDSNVSGTPSQSHVTQSN